MNCCDNPDDPRMWIGELYTWGVNNQGQLGLNDSDPRFVPTLVNNFTGKPLAGNNQNENLKIQVISVAMGLQHTVIIVQQDSKDIPPKEQQQQVRDRRILVCGDNNFGQLGQNLDFHGLPFSDVFLPVSLVSVTTADTAELGPAAEEKQSPTHVAQEVLPVSISCGDNLSIILSENGQLYGWGAGETLQLGGNDMDILQPEKIWSNQPDEVKFTKLDICDVNCAAVTEQGALYVWGFALSPEGVPRKVQCDIQVKQVAVGAQVIQLR